MCKKRKKPFDSPKKAGIMASSFAKELRRAGKASWEMNVLFSGA